MFPLPGEIVNFKILEIDELEVKCLVINYNLKGYFSNLGLIVRPVDLNCFGMGQVISFDHDSKSVKLDGVQILPDVS